MILGDLHRKLLRDVLSAGSHFPLVITGGYAVQAHGLVERLSQDLDLATDSQAPMDEIVAVLSVGLADRGWRVRLAGTDPLSARLVVTAMDGDGQCEVDILRELFWQPPEETEYGKVLALDDVIGTKVRALADRGTVRDLIDVHAAADLRTYAELEALGTRHSRGDFSLEELAMRLSGADWYEDEAFAAYGLSGVDTAAVRSWAIRWADDISRRMASSDVADDGL